jgi:hypothetical protein
MLDGLTDEADPTAEAIRKAAGDPRSVIEMKTKTQCQPLRPDAPLQPLLKGRKHLEILISQAHAGG